MIPKPEPPFFAFEYANVTEEQRQQLYEIQSTIIVVHRQMMVFRSSIALADTGFREFQLLSEGRSPEAQYHFEIIREWPSIAAHSAIAAVFHLQEALNTVRAQIERSSVRHLLAIPSVADDALVLLEKNFPKWEQTRHASAHSAELTLNPDKNWFRGGISRGGFRVPKGSTAMISENFDGRTFLMTRKGELLKFDVT
jgi:hypothetical protein